ncbi:unnamed protein product [Caenorhabditis sp. 36 PRJEB53466]|nr:unnamed protein product [Caenorhabditis sp. 36 PRJEB53466]
MDAENGRIMQVCSTGLSSYCETPKSSRTSKAHSFVIMPRAPRRRSIRTHNFPCFCRFVPRSSATSRAPYGLHYVSPHSHFSHDPFLNATQFLIPVASNQSIMSGWDDYVSLIFKKSTAVKRAAIIGNDGSVWAKSQSPNEFKVNDAELKKFAALFHDINSVPGTGADLENIHYIVPRVEEKFIFGKKEQTGFFAVQTNQAIVIAIYEGDNAMSSGVRAAVEYLGQYLSSAGY